VVIGREKELSHATEEKVEGATRATGLLGLLRLVKTVLEVLTMAWLLGLGLLGLGWLWCGLRALGSMGRVAGGLTPLAQTLVMVVSPVVMVLELLELPAKLEKLGTSPSQKILHPVTHFSSEKMHEEWEGDLREVRWQWQQQGCSQWTVSMRTLSWRIHLLGAHVRCRVYDWVFARYWEKP
jgi:hypothetical protein